MARRERLWKPYETKGVAKDPGIYVRYDRITGEPWPYADGKPCLKVVYRGYDAEGKLRQTAKYASSITDARAIREDLSVAARKGDRQAVGNANITLGDMYERITAQETYAPATLQSRAYAWKHIPPAMRNARLRDVTAKQVDAVCNAVAGSEARQKVRGLIGRLYVHAIGEDLVTTNPAKVKVSSQTRQSRLETQGDEADHVRLSDQQVVDMLEAMDTERDRLLVDLMASVGLRPGEAFALHAEDLEPLKATLKVRRSWVSPTETGPTKTGKQRTVRLPRPLAERLARFVGATTDAIFTTSTGTMNTPANWRRREFARAAKAAGADVTPNSLRHYAVARAISLGADVYHVQNMVGHAKPSITLDVYGYLWKEQDRERDLYAKLEEAYMTRPLPSTGNVVSLAR